MLTLTLLVRRNLGVIAFALIVVAFVAVIAGVALTPARGATPLGDPNAAVVEPTIAPPDSLPPVARPAAAPVTRQAREEGLDLLLQQPFCGRAGHNHPPCLAILP